ncbi:MAG TPA: hypothetical protein VD996_01525 [Chitinophagaceae bacterium]|nr:hypothetical protein [Chitinophagaceae bacterium]
MAKAAAKKSASKKPTVKERTIKYEDKSAGQPDLIPIFDQIKKMASPYVKGHLVVSGDKPGQYGLVSDKVVEVAGRKKDDLYFMGILIQKGYVGFYFMPVYVDPAIKNKLAPELVKCLKGKSCFHIKKNDPALMQHIKDALKVGYEDYKKKGWV